MDKPNLLSVKNLSIAFPSENDENRVVQDVSFELNSNEILGIVGESGSGKSVTTMAVMGLLPGKIAKIKSGSIVFDGKSLLDLKEKQWRSIRGNDISMIFQEPMSALNPSMKCGQQVAEIVELHKKLSPKKAKETVIQLFEKVKLPRPNEIYNSYPHQISGGQMQRVMIAMAIACKPKVLIADEPTTALDVTVQKEIITLLKELQQETGMSIIFISHDLALVSEIANRVLVMYKGKIVEEGSVFKIFHLPENNYTKALLMSRPALDVRLAILPTIASIANGTFKAREIRPGQRAKRHRSLYTQNPILEVSNLTKYYFANMGIFSKSKIVK